MRIAKPLPLDTENGDLVIAPRVDQSSGASSLSKSPEPENLPIQTTSRVQKFGRISKTQAAAKSSKPSRERNVFGRLPQPISKKIRAPVQDLADNDPDLSQLFKKVAKPLPLDTENDDLVVAPRVDQSSGVLSISKSPEPTFASASKKSFSFQRISKSSKSSPASRPSITAKETTSHRTQPILERSIEPAQSQLSSNPTQVADFRLFNSINQPSEPRIVQPLSVTSEEPDAIFTAACPDDKYTYIIPHPEQCDKYYTCEDGQARQELCPDGLVLDIKQVKCVQPEPHMCRERPLLQPSQGVAPCDRKNGVFYSESSCDQFVTCRD